MHERCLTVEILLISEQIDDYRLLNTSGRLDGLSAFAVELQATHFYCAQCDHLLILRGEMPLTTKSGVRL